MSVAQLCGWYGISRQAHYQALATRTARQQVERQVLALVRAWRQRHPRMGARKLLHALGEELRSAGIQLGRDRFFALLRRAGLLLRRRRQRTRTTWPGSWRGVNLLAGLALERPNQAWVSDITYLETEEGFVYLALVMDAFSRCIVGWHLSPSLAVEGAQRALAMATRQAGTATAGLIHHSDHGIQYTCHAYRMQLASQQMRASMGQVGNCYDNARAERLNGILKLEYGLGDRFVDFHHVRRAVKEAVWLYNHERPHLSLAFRKPFEVHTHDQQLSVLN